jgi:hypothetical protein
MAVARSARSIQRRKIFQRHRLRHREKVPDPLWLIEELDDLGQPRICYCFVTDIALVPGDIVLAQKIALETDERAALAMANKFTPKRRLSVSVTSR